MKHQMMTGFLSTLMVLGLFVAPSIASAADSANDDSANDSPRARETGETEGSEQNPFLAEAESPETTRTTRIRVPDARESADSASADDDVADENDGVGAFFRVAVGVGYSRDQTLEFRDTYAVADGVYVDVELAPGLQLDPQHAIHLWLHYQYPALSEKGNYEPNSGEPKSLVSLGLGFTRNSTVSPLFFGINGGVVLSFVDAITDGIRADEVGSPGVGPGGELMLGVQAPVGDAISLGAALVGGARVILTSEEMFSGYYGGLRLLMTLR